MSEFHHVSVLLEECIQGLAIKPDGIYVDGTLGGAGHSSRIAAKLTTGRLIGIDRDNVALEAAAERLKPYEDRVTLVHANFCDMDEALEKLGIDKVDGILLDLGVSSPQLDDGQRGFSYMTDAPLDMRMNGEDVRDARQIVNTWSYEELKRILYDYGEERFAGPIARAIVARRKTKPLETTRELADLVAGVVPRNRKDMGQHPATRTFQAVRIEVNHELDELKQALDAAGGLLKPEGRLAVITFHSLEDRIVKHFFDRAAHPERGLDPRLPLTNDMLPKPLFDNIERIKPSEAECEANPRARSAILRVGVRTVSPWRPEDGACAR